MQYNIINLLLTSTAGHYYQNYQTSVFYVYGPRRSVWYFPVMAALLG